MYGNNLLGWRAWYTEGRTFDSKTLTFQSLPHEGALVFVEYYDTGRRIIDSGDWYYWDPEKQCIEYVPTGDWGTWTLEPKVGDCLSCVKKSGIVDNDTWNVLVQEVWNTRGS